MVLITCEHITDLLAVPVISVIWAKTVVMVSPALAGTALFSIQKEIQLSTTSAIEGRYIVIRYIIIFLLIATLKHRVV